MKTQGPNPWVLLMVVFLCVSSPAPGEQEKWEKKQDVPVTTAWGDACEFGGKIYLIKGGIFEYDPEADHWTRKAGFIPAGDQSVTVLGDRIYATDGRLGMYAYDPIADKVEQKANCRYWKRACPIVALNGKIYAIGGITANHQRLPAFEVYDPATDTWEELDPLPFPWCWQSVCVIDEQIYVFGGADPNSAVSTVMSYSPVTGVWTERNPLPDPRVFLRKSAPLLGGKVYIIGGYRFQARSEMFVYDAAMDSWEAGAEILTARFAHAVAASGNRIYAFGGCIGADFQNQTCIRTAEAYDVRALNLDPRGKLAIVWAALR